MTVLVVAVVLLSIACGGLVTYGAWERAQRQREIDKAAREYEEALERQRIAGKLASDAQKQAVLDAQARYHRAMDNGRDKRVEAALAQALERRRKKS